MPAPPTDPNPARGILTIIVAMTILTVMTALIKAADRIPPGEAVFFRSVLSLPMIAAWLWWHGQLADGLRTARPLGHFSRGLAGSMAMGLGFAGLKFLPLPEVTALRFVTPILIVVFAALILGERVRLIRISAVAAGLLGVIVILWPQFTLGGGSAELVGAGLILGSATLAALAQIFVKSMAGREHTAAIVFYFAATATLLSFLTLPFGWVWPVGVEWALLLGAGFLGAIGQILLTTSYKYADAGVLAPFTYVTMIWAILIGWLVFDELPTVWMLAGSSLIIGAGLVIFFRERALGLRQATEGKVRAKGWQ